VTHDGYQPFSESVTVVEEGARGAVRGVKLQPLAAAAPAAAGVAEAPRTAAGGAQEQLVDGTTAGDSIISSRSSGSSSAAAPGGEAQASGGEGFRIDQLQRGGRKQWMGLESITFLVCVAGGGVAIAIISCRPGSGRRGLIPVSTNER
jgi:hypothetical protein